MLLVDALTKTTSLDSPHVLKGRAKLPERQIQVDRSEFGGVLSEQVVAGRLLEVSPLGKRPVVLPADLQAPLGRGARPLVRDEFLAASDDDRGVVIKRFDLPLDDLVELLLGGHANVVLEHRDAIRPGLHLLRVVIDDHFHEMGMWPFVGDLVDFFGRFHWLATFLSVDRR